MRYLSDRMSLLSNYRLKELIKNESDMSEEEYKSFLNELRKSELLVPIQVELDSIDLNEIIPNEMNRIEREIDFHLKSYIGNDGKRTIPIFTDEEDIMEVKLNTTVGSMFMRDLAESIEPLKDSFDIIVINPKSENSFEISVGEFLELFDEEREFEDLMCEIENDEEFIEELKNE